MDTPVKSEENWIMKNIGILKLIGTILISGSILLLSKYYWPSSAEIILKRAIPLDFHGKVDSVYRDEQNHNVMYVILSTGYVYAVYADWENKIRLGDSLSKNKVAHRFKYLEKIMFQIH
ncbi:hypothetical protein GCM10027037_16220 [Mucilaginibacter koreensis]